MASFVGRLQSILASKWLAVVLISLLLSCPSIFPITNASAQTCSWDWDITSTSGIKTNYQPGETISGDISFRLHNAANSGAIQQLLIGIIDLQNKAIDVKCIYNGIPKDCPEWTTGTATFSLKAPVTPGNYKVIASVDLHNSCSDAINRFPSLCSSTSPYCKDIATITISDGAPPPPPPPPPKEGGTITGSSGSGTTQDGGASKTGVSTQFIIVAVALLVLLLIFSVMDKKRRKGFLRFILILAVISFLGYLLWMYGIPAISKWTKENLSTIIGVLLLVGLLVIAGIAIRKNWHNIFGLPLGPRGSPQPPPKSEKEDYSYIYIMRCPAYRKNLYKVGQSRNPEKRATELSSPTGVAGRFEVLYDDYKLPRNDAILAESRIHKALEKYRATDNREFFEAPINIIIKTIKETVREMGYGDG